MAESFAEFMCQRDRAALAYAKGDSGPVDALTSSAAQVSLFGPDGSTVKGAPAVKQSFDAGAAQFLPCGDSRLEILQMEADGDVGYWSGIQHATVHMRGKQEPMLMDLRITELFRREDGEWKLIHRHADMMKPKHGSERSSAARAI